MGSPDELFLCSIAKRTLRDGDLAFFIQIYRTWRICRRNHWRRTVFWLAVHSDKVSSTFSRRFRRRSFGVLHKLKKRRLVFRGNKFQLTLFGQFQNFVSEYCLLCSKNFQEKPVTIPRGMKSRITTKGMSSVSVSIVETLLPCIFDNDGGIGLQKVYDWGEHPLGSVSREESSVEESFRELFDKSWSPKHGRREEGDFD